MPNLRVLALMEAEGVAGPAKNLLRFAANARGDADGGPTAEITIVGYRRGGFVDSAFLKRAHELDIPTETIAEGYRFDPRVLSRLESILDRVKPDIIQTHNVKSHLVVRLTGAYRRQPWIAFHHGYTTTDLKVRAYNQCDRFSLPRAARVVTVCAAFVGQLVDRGVQRDKIVVRHNTIDSFAPAPAGEVEGLRNEFGLAGRTVAVSIGRLSREKGHVELIEAWSLLPVHYRTEVRLVLVGEGPERRAVEQRISALGLDEQVVLAGYHSDVRPWYQVADLLVLPSHSEGSPNVLLEAMAAQVPIVATCVGGVPEVVEDERSGLLVPASNAKAMALAIERVLSDETLRQSIVDNGLRRCRQEFAPDTYRRALLQLYTEVAGVRFKGGA